MRQRFDIGRRSGSARALIEASDVKKTCIAFGGQHPLHLPGAILPNLTSGSGYIHWVAVDPAIESGLGYAVSLATLYRLSAWM